MKVIYLWLENDYPVYVGQSIDWDQRLNHYQKILKGTKKPTKYKNTIKLNEAKMAAHPERFSYKILEIQNKYCTKETLNKAEKFWIKYYNTFYDVNPKAYNLTTGGEGYEVSELHRQHLSESHIGIQAGENHPMYGKHHTEESKQKMAQAKIGKENKKLQKPIRCIIDGKEYKSLKELCNNPDYRSVFPSNVSRNCRGESEYAGHLVDGTLLKFEYIN